MPYFSSYKTAKLELIEASKQLIKNNKIKNNLMLKIKNLEVEVENKRIIKGLNLEIDKNEIHALVGPNASGKSTLAYTIMGIPKYKVVKGFIKFEGKNVNKLPPEKRARLGIALAFQHPPSLNGIKLSTLLQKIGKVEIKIPRFEKLLEREVNVNFSGGEKKISELIQLIALNPKLAILDELDSGLDIQTLKLAVKLIKENLLKNGCSILIITHTANILQFLNPNKIHVMLGGKIICSSSNWRKVWKTVKTYGYEKCQKCLSPSK